MQKKTKLLLFFLMVIIQCILVGIIKALVDIPDNVFWKTYYAVGMFVVLCAIIFNGCYHIKYEKKMQAAIKILDENPEEYINIVSDLLEKSKSRYLHTLFTINLSVGYSDMKDYKKAISLLESVSSLRMLGFLKMIHKLNLCCNYYYDGQEEKAKEIYEKNLKVFIPYRKASPYSGNIAVLDIFINLINREYDLAEENFSIAKRKWTNPRLQEDFLHIEEILKANGTILELVYEEFSQDKKHKIEIIKTSKGLYKVWLLKKYDGELSGYFDFKDNLHITDTLEKAKKIAKDLL
ncbi:MAG: hypothetical protein ACRCW1_01580 [Anaerotignaceae bacterium]